MSLRLNVTDQWQIAKKRIVVCCGCVGLSLFAIAWFGLHQSLQASENMLPDGQVHAAPTKIHPNLVANYGKLPLSFEANQGQVHGPVKFLSHGRGYTIFLTGDEAVLELEKPSVVSRRSSVGKRQKPGGRSQESGANSGPRTIDSGPRTTNAVLRMKLVGASASAAVTGAAELPGKSNYFIGNDAKKWRTNVPTYAKVKYAGVYPGVDLVYYGNQGGQLEYDFVVAPGADPAAIRLALSGRLEVGSRQPAGGSGSQDPTLSQSKIQNLKSKIDPSGDLVIKTDSGEIRFHKPLVYQPAMNEGRRTTDNGLRTPVEGHYVLQANNQIRFKVPSYDHTRPLVIDPALSYSTYLGGSSEDEGYGIAVDSLGYAYVVGTTLSTDFPIAGSPIQSTCEICSDGYSNVFVTKVNTTGTALVYSTFLSGSGGANGTAIAIDSAGDAYVTGATDSTDFPLANPVQALNNGGGEAFVAELNPTGSGLVYSTYLGGGYEDSGTGIAVDSSGRTYVTGVTSSSDFPTAHAFQATCGSCAYYQSNAFVTKLKFVAEGNSLTMVYSTFLGGSTGADGGRGIAVDSSGNAYVTGFAESTDFPTRNPLQASLAGGNDAFVSRLSWNGEAMALIYSTYLGGEHYDQGNGIAVDSSGNAYVTGWTVSTEFPTMNPYQATNNASLESDSDNATAFVTKLNWSGTTLSLVYSTFLGGSSEEEGNGIAVDSSGNAYVTGVTYSSDFPTTADAIQATCPDCYYSEGRLNDAFVAELNWTGSTLGLGYSTYLGGSAGNAQGNGIAVDSTANAYVTGQAGSTLPTSTDAFQASNNGGVDAFVTKISMVTAAPAVGFSPLAGLAFGSQMIDTTSTDLTVTVTDTGNADLNISSVTIGGTNPGDFAKSADTCTMLDPAPNGTCTVSVTFTPTAAGNRSATLIFTDNASDSPQSVPLTGTGTAPVASVSAPLTFSGQALGTTSASQAVTLSNTTGTADLTIASIAITGADAGDFAVASAGTTCSTSNPVAAGGTCTINVTFTPTAAGSRAGTLTFTDNSNGVADSTQTVGLSGTGTTPVASLSPPLTFSSQIVGTTSTSQAVTLSNATGTAALTIASISITGANAGDFAVASAGTTCSTSSPVAAGGSCTINVTFTPTATGTRSGTLTVTDNSNGVAGSTQTVTLSGTGTGVALASFSASSLTLANQPISTTSTVQTETVTNTGTLNLTITAVTLGGTNASDFVKTADTCTGATVIPNGTCMVSVTFTPTATGARSATLTFTDNNNNLAGSTQAVTLSGVGVDFAVASPTGAQTVAQGGKAVYTINLTSVGGTDSSAVTLACSNLPALATCAFGTNPVTPGASGGSSTLTITTTAPVYARMFPHSPGRPPAALPALLLAMMLPALVGWWRVRRQSPRWAAATCLLFGVLLATTFMAGCGAGGYNLPKVGGTPVGSYTVTVTGTSGTTQHTTTVTLNVTAS
jgi:hypothetical protein